MSSVLNDVAAAEPGHSGSVPVERCPLPIPYGWFFVSYGEDLKPGELRNKIGRAHV